MSVAAVRPTPPADITRRWIRPKVSRGPWWRRRLWVAWGLIVLFTAIPYVKMGGKPLILLDVLQRQFTVFGTTFLPTDTMLLMLLLVGAFLAIFLLTAIAGRVWCGWACPQTVYMEFVFRPLERLFEGNRAAQARLDREGPNLRRILKWGAYAVISLFLANTFLAYFVGVDALRHWVTGSPGDHWGAFLVVAVVTVLMFLDFGVLREQVCLFACPYGRFQSVLLDRRSLIVGYDARRGEPRGLLALRGSAEPHGDCIDCGACVITCPTGIDIRDGLQMECIHCTQCADACDTVMEKIGKRKGLIRYGSEDELEGKPRRILRPRVLLYPLLIAAVWGGLGWALAHRQAADVTVLRGIGMPFAILPDGRVSNQLRVKVVNRAEGDRRYAISVDQASDLALVSPDNPLEVGAGKSGTATVFVTGPRSAFPEGERHVTLVVDDGAGFRGLFPYELVGPEETR